MWCDLGTWQGHKKRNNSVWWQLTTTQLHRLHHQLAMWLIKANAWHCHSIKWYLLTQYKNLNNKNHQNPMFLLNGGSKQCCSNWFFKVMSFEWVLPLSQPKWKQVYSAILCNRCSHYMAIIDSWVLLFPRMKARLACLWKWLIRRLAMTLTLTTYKHRKWNKFN